MPRAIRIAVVIALVLSGAFVVTTRTTKPAPALLSTPTSGYYICVQDTYGANQAIDGTQGCPPNQYPVFITTTSGPVAQILFVHGLSENNHGGTGNGDFNSLFTSLANAYPNFPHLVQYFDYYQDLDGDGTQPPMIPSDLAGMPVSLQFDPTIKDSASDLGLNVLALEQKVESMVAANGLPVILVGYSMGASLIRGMLAYSQDASDGVAATMVDSVFTLHGVQQGSFLADAFEGGAGVSSPIPSWLWEPFVQRQFDRLLGSTASPYRPAVRELQTNSPWFQYVNSHSQPDELPPNLPTYNTFGDMKVATKLCVWTCQTLERQSFGDVFILPGVDDPTATPSGGGAKFLPGGADGANNYEWDETLSALT
jgi:pimeloyl-ACP methyl ester carboxylesterase